MIVREANQADKENFNSAATHPLQSWEWGNFRQKTGNLVVRLAAFEDDKLKESYQLIGSNLPKSRFTLLYFPRGPLPHKKMLDAAREVASQNNSLFVRMEPNVARLVREDQEPENPSAFAQIEEFLKKEGARLGRPFFTKTSFWIDLTKDEDELLAGFDPKTRYNIKVAQKNEVEVLEDNSDAAFEKYIELTRETVKRQGFYAHSEKYHRLMWETLHKQPMQSGKQPIARLLIAKYRAEIITTWILFVWRDFLYYPYGASTDKYKNTMANNLIMWEAMRFAKKLGLKTFDLWGREEGKGFTRFKEGYNPKVVEFLGTWDLVLSSLYYPYRVAETLRWIFLHTRGKFVRPNF